MFARVSTVISIYITWLCTYHMFWLITLSFMYINVRHTLSFRGCGKRDDKVNIYLHDYVYNNEFHTRAAYIIIWGGLVREMI